jgi:hypothetical protein
VIYWTLAIRHLLVRPGRAAVLLAGYVLGVAVMIVLLSIGDAMLDQSRDRSLIGGGELTALPHGIDIEAMRTGGLAGMFFSINGARFVTREMLGGRRQSHVVAAVSPLLEQKLVRLAAHDTEWTVRAGADIPSAAQAAGTALHLVAGSWTDSPRDRDWLAPTPQLLYDQIDHFHRPAAADSTWAEWHYFNITTSAQEWWYITLLVGGDMMGARWGGQVLVTHRRSEGTYQRFTASIPASTVTFDTVHADLTLGGSSVQQRDGRYRVVGSAGGASFDLLITPAPAQYFPPVELGDDHQASGYVVPALVARATGRLCDSRGCENVREVPAYHDHNWGSWRAVTWEWGAGFGDSHALLYGGVRSGVQGAGNVPLFLALEDSLGVQQVYRLDAVERLGHRDVPGAPGIVAPDSLRLTAGRGADTLRVVVRVVDVAASVSRAAPPGEVFLQMRGRWRAVGTAAGRTVSDSGLGYFETWVTAPRPPRD